MGVIDLSFLGHLSTSALASSSAASITMRVTGVMLWGSTSALNTLCSQALGAGNLPLVSIWLQTALVVFTVASFLVMGTWGFLTEPMLRLLGFKSDVTADAKLVRPTKRGEKNKI